MATRRYGKFADLKAQKIVGSWPMLTRWINKYGFPPPIRPTPGTTLFDLDEVDAWLQSRRAPTTPLTGEPPPEAKHKPGRAA